MNFDGKVLPIECSLNDDFFLLWLEYLTPKHGLTRTQMLVLAEFLKERYILSKKITDLNLLDEISMNTDTKKRIRDKCNIKESHFQVLMGVFKKKGIIINNRINPAFIPKVYGNDFKLVVWFKFNEQENIQSGI